MQPLQSPPAPRRFLLILKIMQMPEQFDRNEAQISELTYEELAAVFESAYDSKTSVEEFPAEEMLRQERHVMPCLVEPDQQLPDYAA